MWAAANPTRRGQPLLRVIKQRQVLAYFCILNFNIPISYILTFGWTPVFWTPYALVQIQNINMSSTLKIQTGLLVSVCQNEICEHFLICRHCATVWYMEGDENYSVNVSERLISTICHHLCNACLCVVSFCFLRWRHSRVFLSLLRLSGSTEVHYLLHR